MQNYPAKPIHIHAPAGGGADLITRLIAPELRDALGQEVVVENHPADPGLATGVARAAPDGHTLLLSGGSVWLDPVLREVPYDPFRDLAAITMITRTPALLVVTPSLPVKTMADLIQLARKKPGQLISSSGSPGAAGSQGLALLNSLAGINIARVQQVDKKQDREDLVSGKMHVSWGTPYVALVKSGKVRALGTGGTQRSIIFPDVPTISETVPGFVVETILALWAPAKTPEAIVKRLHQEIVRIMKKPEVRERMLTAGAEPGGCSPEELTDYMKSAMARMSKVLKPASTKSGES